MMPTEFDITGKIVFITGAGRGIGKGIAQVLAEAGADVALNALTPKYVDGSPPISHPNPAGASFPSSPTLQRRTRSGAPWIRSWPRSAASMCW